MFVIKVTLVAPAAKLTKKDSKLVLAERLPHNLHHNSPKCSDDTINFLHNSPHYRENDCFSVFRENWKRNQAVKHVFSWLLVQVGRPWLADYLEKVFPPSLLISDDYRNENKVLGVHCLHHIVLNVVREADQERDSYLPPHSLETPTL